MDHSFFSSIDRYFTEEESRKQNLSVQICNRHSFIRLTQNQPESMHLNKFQRSLTRWRVTKQQRELIHYRNCWRRQRASREVLKSFSFPRLFLFREKTSINVLLRLSFRRRCVLFVSFAIALFTILLFVRFYCVCFRDILYLKSQQQSLRLL